MKARKPDAVCSRCGSRMAPHRLAPHARSRACQERQAWQRGASAGIRCAPAGEDAERAELRASWRSGYRDGQAKRLALGRADRGALKALQDKLARVPGPVWSCLQEVL